jgi:hypothetical protein
MRRSLSAVAPLAAPAVVLVVLIAAATAGCTTTTGDGPATGPDYATALAAVCRQTDIDLDAVPRPPDATTAELGSAVAALLVNEAERARALDAPDALRDDHRAFVLNTDEQASAWTALADADATDLESITARIGSLALGRNDLVTEMGVEGCVRAGT